MSNHGQTLDQLRTKLKDLECSCHASGEIVTTGAQALDDLLGGGLKRGTLVEWLGIEASGAMTLAIIAARIACENQGTMAIVDDKKQFYPPAVAALGVDLARVVILQPGNASDYAWCVHQTLRSPGVAAVLCHPGKIHERMMRRWQLAAERGGALGLLVRPIEAQNLPSWAKVRVVVEAGRSQGMERRWQLSIAGSHAKSGKTIEVEIDHENGRLREASPMPMASELALAAARQKAAGA
jgi:protein ImuA